jgi:4-hydroxy-tetrahydrodipicolinate synthase
MPALTPEEARARLRGSIVPMVSPFRRGRLDEDGLRRLIDWQIASGSHGISVAGTTGEPSALSPEERERLIAVAVEQAGGRVPVLAGTGSNNLQETLRFTAFAERAGADAVLVIVPYYNRPSQEGLYRHFAAVASSTSLPLVIYNIPGRTAVNMEPETMARLRRDHPNVVGVKEANVDMQHVSRVLAACGRDFLVYSGIEALCFPMLALGGAGHVSATANVLPAEVAQLYDLCAAGRWEQARDLHYRLLALNEVLFVETNPGPLKYALGLLGRIDPEIRLPLAPPSPANQARIRTVLTEYGLLH